MKSSKLHNSRARLASKTRAKRSNWDEARGTRSTLSIIVSRVRLPLTSRHLRIMSSSAQLLKAKTLIMLTKSWPRKKVKISFLRIKVLQMAERKQNWQKIIMRKAKSMETILLKSPIMRPKIQPKLENKANRINRAWGQNRSSVSFRRIPDDMTLIE